MKSSQNTINKSEISSLKILMMAARPKTLSVSSTPILVGTFLAFHKVNTMQWGIAFLALICAFLIQIGINIINDALDFKKGADFEGRLGPQRVTQTGLMSYQQVLNYGLGCFTLAIFLGIPLIIVGGWPLFCALLTSVVFGYLYTGGPFPLAYKGLGEIFVLIFFGYVITCSAFYLQTGYIDSDCLLAATQIGFLAMITIIINNTRDIATDRLANKKTLSVRFGLNFSRWEIVILSVFAYILGIFWIEKGYTLVVVLTFLVLPLIYKNAKNVFQNPPSIAYNEYLAKSAQNQLLFGLLLICGYLFS